MDKYKFKSRLMELDLSLVQNMVGSGIITGGKQGDIRSTCICLECHGCVFCGPTNHAGGPTNYVGCLFMSYVGIVLTYDEFTSMLTDLKKTHIELFV